MKNHLYKIYLNDVLQEQMEVELGSFADHNFIFLGYSRIFSKGTCILCGCFSHSWELGDTTHVELAKERINNGWINLHK